MLDLRGTQCPLNYIKCKLRLEELQPKDVLEVRLDKGEPELLVVSALRKDGYQVEIIAQDTDSVIATVICAKS